MQGEAGGHVGAREGDPLDSPPQIELRVPGPWGSVQALSDALAEANAPYQLDGAELVHRNSGQRISWTVSEHDNDIAQVFAGGGSLSREEVDRLASHRVKIHLSGAGGSVEMARAIVDAATSLVCAGGFGVMVDNSGLTHSPQDWLDLAGDPQAGGLYWAFVAATFDGQDAVAFSSGMHCLGLRDAELPTHDIPNRQIAGFLLHNFLGYTYQSGRTVLDGDTLNDESGACFRARHVPCTRFKCGTPFFNPYGVWRLEPIEAEHDEQV
ncbi:MAG TPA: hypothetical protein VL282_17785 [Tepidisphaeraceae bacterium]|nr:hypothetical protein [Tepidisphaeraceae bacterium]